MSRHSQVCRWWLGAAVALLLAACGGSEEAVKKPESSRPRDTVSTGDPAAQSAGGDAAGQQGVESAAKSGGSQGGSGSGAAGSAAMAATGATREGREAAMGKPRDTPPDAEPEQKETGPPPIRIAILSSPTHPLAGEQVGLILSKYQKEQLERALAQPIKIAFISQSNAKHEEKTHVRYRDPYLRAAIHVAGAIPREQVVEPMNSDERLREQVDLFIYVGERVR